MLRRSIQRGRIRICSCAAVQSPKWRMVICSYAAVQPPARATLMCSAVQYLTRVTVICSYVKMQSPAQASLICYYAAVQFPALGDILLLCAAVPDTLQLPPAYRLSRSPDSVQLYRSSGTVLTEHRRPLHLCIAAALHRRPLCCRCHK